MAARSFWMERLETLPKFVCHRCKKQTVLSDKKPAFSFFKPVRCYHCKAPLTGFARWFDANLFFIQLLIFFLPLAYLIYLLMIASWFNPVREAKMLVRAHYDKKYGARSQEKLWQDWGWVYGGQSSASQDYQQHKK
jgi:hypothetical protein